MATWNKIIVEGDESVLRGFLAGFGAGQPAAHEGALLGTDVPIAPGGLTERIQALLAAGSHQVVLAPEPFTERLLAALHARGGDVGLRVEKVAEVAGATFHFQAETFNGEVAARLRQSLLEGLPDGVELRDLDTDERREPEAEGQEMYSPVHHYELHLRGQVVGPLPGVLEMHRRARELEAVTPDPVQIHVAR